MSTKILSVAACVTLSIAPSAQRPAPAAGPYVHKVLSASSPDGLAWTRDAGVRLEHASVPAVLVDAGRVLLYYVDADRGPGQPESVGCAASADGLSFEKRACIIEGLSSRKALDPSIVKDPAGRFRLYYLASNADGDPASEQQEHDIRVALSEDGVRFREAGVAFRSRGLVDPDVFFFKGTWFMYVFARNRTIIATSTDGLGFTYKQELAPPGYGTVAPIAIDDDRLRLYAFEQRQPAGNAVVSFTSTDGLAWTRDAGVRLQAGPDEQITDPFVVRWRGGFKMYFKAEPARQPGPGLGPGASFNPQGGPDRPSTGPWDHDAIVYRVTADGRAERLATFERAGVPTAARMKDGRLVAAHQHFPADNDADFDKVAVRFSSDEGKSWTPPQVIRVSGLGDGMRFPFDPTLVPLPDGRIRLYFTSTRGRQLDAGRPAIYSAVSTNGIDYVVDPGVRFGIEGRMVIDCAVALHDGVFHLFAPDNGAIGQPGAPAAEGERRGTPPGQRGTGVPGGPPPRPAGAGGGAAAIRPLPGKGYHATSTDGLAFTRQADVQIDGRRRWLGNAQSDGGRLVFFGTAEGSPGAPGGVWTARSADGVTWESVQDFPAVAGADPGAVKLNDGAWLVLVTGPARSR